MTITISKELPPIPDVVTNVHGIPVKGDFRKECCTKKENLEYHEYDPVKGITVYRCRHCGCRHFEINAEPGRLGLK